MKNCEDCLGKVSVFTRTHHSEREDKSELSMVAVLCSSQFKEDTPILIAPGCIGYGGISNIFGVLSHKIVDITINIQMIGLGINKTLKIRKSIRESQCLPSQKGQSILIKDRTDRSFFNQPLSSDRQTILKWQQDLHLVS